MYDDAPMEFKPNASINVPTYHPKYVVGDVVYLPNELNKLGIYVKVLDYTLQFSEFSFYSDGNVQTPRIMFGSYFCQIMSGSYGNIVRMHTDGILVGYIAMNVLLIDEYAFFVGHTTGDYVLYNLGTLVSEINQIDDSEKANSAVLLNL